MSKRKKKWIVFAILATIVAAIAALFIVKKRRKSGVQVKKTGKGAKITIKKKG